MVADDKAIILHSPMLFSGNSECGRQDPHELGVLSGATGEASVKEATCG